MLTIHVTVRNALRDLSRFAHHSLVGDAKPACLSRSIASIVQRVNNVSTLRAYATGAGERASRAETPGRPKGTTIAKGASPKTKKTTTASTAKSKKSTKVATTKKPKRTVLTEHDKMVKQVRKLKTDALLDQPKGLPTNGWLVYILQNHSRPAEIKALGSKFKDLSQSEKDVSI